MSPIEYSWHRKHASINETVIILVPAAQPAWPLPDRTLSATGRLYRRGATSPCARAPRSIRPQEAEPRDAREEQLYDTAGGTSFFVPA